MSENIFHGPAASTMPCTGEGRKEVNNINNNILLLSTSTPVSADIALDLLHTGLSFLPVGTPDDPKKPALLTWKELQSRQPTEKEARLWFGRPREAIGVVTGAVSGNLVCFDFDHGGVCYEPWKAMVPAELFAKLVVETSRSGGGRHAYFRQTHKPKGPEVFACDEKCDVLIESRGEGNYVLATPSVGQRFLQGDFAHLAVLTDEEYETLETAARSFNRWEEPAAARNPLIAISGSDAAAGTRPGDLYNVRGAEHFAQVLAELGWQRVGGAENDQRWRRPGKDEGGCSGRWSSRVRSRNGRWPRAGGPPRSSHSPRDPRANSGT